MIIGIERSDGGLSVMTLVDGIQTVEEIDVQVKRWEEGNGQGWACVRWEAIDDYPPRENRNAYEMGRFRVVLNEAKAGSIARGEQAPNLGQRVAALEAALNIRSGADLAK